MNVNECGGFLLVEKVREIKLKREEEEIEQTISIFKKKSKTKNRQTIKLTETDIFRDAISLAA